MDKLPLAVLIDGENVSASHMPTIMEHAKRLGEPLARCVVGDFAANRLSEWADIAPEHALETCFQRTGGKNKNSADIALTIRAMDLLAERRFGSFLIVSSDRDFAPLALRLHRSGFPVYGMGTATAGSAWRAACTEFFELVKRDPAGNANGAAIDTPAPVKKASPSAKPAWSNKDRDAVAKSLKKAASEKSPWIRLCQLGQHLRADSAPLAKRLRNGRLLKNLRLDPLFCLQGKNQNIEVRLKASEMTKPRATPPTPSRTSPQDSHALA
jgi:hypothetical protein